MNSDMKRGLLIAFEGLDRCGKSTQCQLLCNYFIQNEKNAEIISFPNRESNIGKIIDQYLKGEKKLNDQVIHLLFSCNRWEQEEYIKNKCNQGVNLIFDRYAYSGVAFSAAKGLDMEWCKNPDRGLPEPDVVFYLKVDEKQAMERKDYGAEVYEKQNFQAIVKQQYEKLQLGQSQWIVKDASLNVDELHKQIVTDVQNLLNKEQNTKSQIKQLWMNQDQQLN